MVVEVSNDGIIDLDHDTIYVYVPENFDAQTILNAHPKWADSANWLMDRLYLYSHFAMRRNQFGFTPLKVEYLRRVIPQSIERELRQRLEAAGVIACDHWYVEGEKSFGYRLTEPYQAKHRRIPIRHPLIRAKIERLRQGDLGNISKVHRHLFQQFNRLTFDLSGVEVNAPERKAWVNFSEMAIEQMRNKEWTPTVCQYGRFHTPLTRLMSEYRVGLRLDGKRVINLDIANSQPLFLSVLFLKVLSRLREEINGRISWDEGVLNTLTKLNLLPEDVSSIAATKRLPYTMVSVNNLELPEDVREYIELTQAGQLYEYLAQHSRLSRREFKERLFQDVFFGQNFIQSALTQEFQRLFPNVMEFIRRIKRGNYARLA